MGVFPLNLTCELISIAKRDGEQLHLERVGYLFKVEGTEKSWTKVDILSFGKTISLINWLK